ncbi:MAG: radical SAM protein [Candidatus Sericytochromatia bacterium]|nr:radical SAM protein [Candidatus Sericytochromatia bacterium]
MPEPQIALVDVAYDTYVPLFASIELTLRCNLRCTHCYNFDRDMALPAGEELTPDEVMSVIDELVSMGALEICFTGGEALLHPHLLDFVRHARRSLAAVRIKSNGVALTGHCAQLLYDAQVHAIDLSLYGASAKTHDALTRVAGSFSKTLAGARAARDAGMRVSLSFCVTTENSHEVEAMLGISEREGFGFTLDPQISARYDGTRTSLAHRVPLPVLEQLYRGPLREALGQPTCRNGQDMQCSCARAVVAVSAQGDVYPCIAAPIPSGNIRQGGLKRIWETSPELTKVRGLTLSDYSQCAPCPDRGYCRRSNGVSLVNTGEYTGVDPWNCGEAAIIRAIAEQKPPCFSNGSPASPHSTSP